MPDPTIKIKVSPFLCEAQSELHEVDILKWEAIPCILIYAAGYLINVMYGRWKSDLQQSVGLGRKGWSNIYWRNNTF